MSKTVWKFSIPVDDKAHEIQLPLDSLILHCASQHTSASVELWVEINQNTDKLETLEFQVFGTGHNIPNTAQYIGTTLTTPGLVWHLYRVA